MRLTLITPTGKRAGAIPPHDAPSAIISGACPACGEEPFHVGGCGKRAAADDRAYEADGRCMACLAEVGILRVDVDTIFGVTEDEAVTEGRPRVYGGDE